MELNITTGITGADGFIGKNVCEYLSARHIEVKKFSGDLLNEQDLLRYFSEHQIETIIHLVGTFELPFENQITLNALATQKLLDIGVRHGLKKLIFASTGAVYGESPLQGSQETDELKPNTLYGLSKMWAEDCIRYYTQNFNVQYIILRFPNVYGPTSTKGVIYNFLKSIQESNKVTIYGTGEQKRNFLFIDDAAEAIELVLKYEGSNEIFNIAHEELYSLRDVVRILQNKGLTFVVRQKDAEVSNALQVLSENTQKAKSILGWQPKINLDQGIDQLIKEFNLSS